MRFFRDDPRTTEVTWFFVDEGIPFIPYPTPFRSLNDWWGEDGPEDDLGEVRGAPRVPVRGNPIGNASAENFCGSAEQWLNGESLPPDPQPARNLYGTPICCKTYDPPFLHFGCVNCPLGAYSDYTLVAAGANPLGPFAQSNGIWRLTYDGFCTWIGPPFPVGAPFFGTARWRLTVRGPLQGFAGIVPAHAGGDALYPWIEGWDCLSEMVLPQVPADAVPDAAPRVTILPGVPLMPPVGSVFIWAGTVLPAKFLRADGSAVLRQQYSELFAALGTTFGPGDGLTTFTLPGPPLALAAGLQWVIVAMP